MGAAIAGGLTGVIKHVLDAADDMGKLAQATGTTTEKLSVLEYAADLANVSNEQLGVGLESSRRIHFKRRMATSNLPKSSADWVSPSPIQTDT